MLDFLYNHFLKGSCCELINLNLKFSLLLLHNMQTCYSHCIANNEKAFEVSTITMEAPNVVILSNYLKFSHWQINPMFNITKLSKL